ncbi:MAG: hypothetical protein JWL96_494 [Sphingomonas bacterium]|nr:hypothetical protein [Sphingomonas bacterium]
MNDRVKGGHHPLPRDERARHDLIPETIEDERDKGDDAPDDQPSPTDAPSRTYANPDGSRYPG